jgi:putative hemolysin
MTTHRRPKITYSSEVNGKTQKILVQSLEYLTGRRRLEKLYGDVLDRVDREGIDIFWAAALNALDVQLEYDRARLTAIPHEGPLIFIANHPYGVLDGLTLCYLAATTRHEWRILINNSLCKEERIASFMLPIDFTGTDEATHTNIKTKRKSIETLRNNGAVVIFPAGGIATSIGAFGKEATDLDWKLFTAKLIQTTRATVVPVFFYGQNSRLFQIVSQFSLTLRLALIIYEVNKQIAKPLRLTIGQPIPYEQMANIKGRQALTDYLRQVTYTLGGRQDYARVFSKFETTTPVRKPKLLPERKPEHESSKSSPIA